MEIFLLIILILLSVFFYSSLSGKFNELDEKIKVIYKLLKSADDRAIKEKIESIKPEKPLVKPEAKVQEKAPETAASVKPTPVIPLVTPKISEQKPATVAPEKTEEKPVQKAAFSAPVPTPATANETKPRETAPKPITKPTPPPIVEDDWYTRFRKNNPDIEKFIGENLISKIGIAILVIGIALFVKYAIDKNWINETARAGIGILCGGIVLGFAHRLRLKFKAFSSVLVAGGISIFYFTIGIAFHQYHLFNQTTAFIIMLVITCFSVFLSIAYNRVELAALSLIGGFATPLMVSTGSGNYQVLFTYVIILDTGMLVLAYLRKWNLINIMAYAFTMLLYFIWLQTKVINNSPAPYAGALLFGGIFYVMFVLMNIINNIKERREFKAVELSILLSNTVLFYIAGMQILYYYNHEMRGLFNVLLAVFNMVCALLLYKKFKADAKLIYLLIGITLTFITIAAPIQLNGHYITLVWACEGVMLLWLAQRSNIVLYRFASVLVNIIMLGSLIITWAEAYNNYSDFHLTRIFNKGFITGVAAALCMFATSYLLRNEKENFTYLGINFDSKNYRTFTQIAFTLLLYIAGLFELFYQLQTTGNSNPANYIVIEVYHLVFLILVNTTLAKKDHPLIQKTLYTANYVSVLAFVFLFAYFPLADFKIGLFRHDSSEIGFIFHYLQIIAALYLVKLTHNNRHKITFEHQGATNTVLLTASVVYIASVELILHISKFTVHKMSNLNINEFDWQKIRELADVQLHVIKIGLPILWGFLAFAYLFLGMKKQEKKLRVIGLVLIGITLLKLFIFDINHSSESGKIVSFVILGIVLLVISFMYQKIKALLRSDDKKEQITPKNDNIASNS